jgi:hypothetical protein
MADLAADEAATKPYETSMKAYEAATLVDLAADKAATKADETSDEATKKVKAAYEASMNADEAATKADLASDKAATKADKAEYEAATNAVLAAGTICCSYLQRSPITQGFEPQCFRKDK